MMMTMGIRNGLTALKVGQDSYLTALAATARHTWGLPEALVGKVGKAVSAVLQGVACTHAMLQVAYKHHDVAQTGLGTEEATMHVSPSSACMCAMTPVFMQYSL